MGMGQALSYRHIFSMGCKLHCPHLQDTPQLNRNFSLYYVWRKAGLLDGHLLVGNNTIDLPGQWLHLEGEDSSGLNCLYFEFKANDF